MAKVVVNGTIPAPAARVWEVAGDFGRIAEWVPALASSELKDGATGSQVGDVRQCQLDGGPSLNETQTARSDTDRTYTYAIPESPLPMKNYESTIQLHEQGEQTVLEWSSTFDADPGAEEEVKGMISGVYQAGIASLRQRFQG